MNLRTPDSQATALERSSKTEPRYTYFSFIQVFIVSTYFTLLEYVSTAYLGKYILKEERWYIGGTNSFSKISK